MCRYPKAKDLARWIGLGLVAAASLAASPTIDDFSPKRGGPGTSVTVVGSGFTANGPIAVSFGGADSSNVELIDYTRLVAQVPGDAVTGPVAASTCSGRAESSSTFEVLPPSIIEGFAPTSGPAGTIVTITGSGLGETTAVLFWNQPNHGENGVGLAGVNLEASDTRVTVEVPGGATVGPLSLFSPAAPLGASLPDTFAAHAETPPVIETFAPAACGNGPVLSLDTLQYTDPNVYFSVTLTGAHFTGTRAVDFVSAYWGERARSETYVVTSDTEIVAQVPLSSVASGPIVVTNDAGSASTEDWAFVPRPAITYFLPRHAMRGAEVTIFGTGFSRTAAVFFEFLPASFNLPSAGETDPLIVPVPDGAVSGMVTVITTGGHVKAFFGVDPGPDTPIISGFSPTSGAAADAMGAGGTWVTLTGSGFTGATSLTFNGTEAMDIYAKPPPVRFLGDTELVALVPAGATTGPIYLTALGEADTTALDPPDFTVLAPPAITGVEPWSAMAGSEVAITGENLGDASSIIFTRSTGEAVPAAFAAVDETELSVTVPVMGAGEVSIAVTTAGGIARNESAPFAVAGSAPTLFAFAPTSGSVGDTVTLTGTGFDCSFSISHMETSVRFDDAEADLPFSWNPCGTVLTVKVPQGATTGPISVTTPWGSATTAPLTPGVFKVQDPSEADAGAGSDASVPAARDAGEDGEARKESSQSCGCSATGAAPGAFALALLALGSTAARRRARGGCSARRLEKCALSAALGLILLLSGCGGEGEPGSPDGASSFDSGADDVCAPTRAALQDLEYWIAFDSNRNDQNRDVYVMRPNGEEIRRLTTGVSVDRHPRFSPDGQRIVFVSERAKKSALYLVDLSTKEKSGPISRDGADFPDWSPDGERIAFTLDGLLYDVRPDGSDERLLLDLTADYGYFIEHPVYSSNGQHIYWHLTYWSSNGIGRCNADGSDFRPIVPPDPAGDDRRGADAPSPSPDGISVAFRTFCGPNDPGLENPEIVARSSAIYVVSRDGYVSTLGENVCAYGTRLTSLEEPYASNPSWGPGFIAFESGEWNRVIKVIDPATGVSCYVTESPFDDRNPAWSPAGAAIP
jgi:Tol biopolymer transport system component